MILRSGYFPNLKGGPTVLFWGDANAMQQLASILRASAIGKGTLALNTVIKAVDDRPIMLKTVAKAEGMQVVEDTHGHRSLEWLLDPETMVWFAELLESLAQSDGPGHQFLDTLPNGQITVMAASNEYPAELQPD
jgi:hypothetical protein